jgi:flagellar biosynthesis protein FlhG
MKPIGMDQAEGLRTYMESPLENASRSSGLPSLSGRSREPHAFPWPRVISVGSGKGGVGKTNVVANLAFAFTRLGKRVLVLDADLGLANIDVLLGLAPQYTIEHLLNRQKSVFEILIPGPGGMSILPASSGVTELANLDEGQKIFLLNELEQVAESIDILLIDTAAGISSNVLYFNMAAEESIVVVTPEPPSITDAYALIKVLTKKYRKDNFTILINAAKNGEEAKEVFKKITKVVDRFLGSLSIDYLGFIPADEKIPLAVKSQRPVLEAFPRAISSRSFLEIAKRLVEKPQSRDANGNVQFFWKHLFQCQQTAIQDGRAD